MLLIGLEMKRMRSLGRFLYSLEVFVEALVIRVEDERMLEGAAISLPNGRIVLWSGGKPGRKWFRFLPEAVDWEE